MVKLLVGFLSLRTFGIEVLGGLLNSVNSEVYQTSCECMTDLNHFHLNSFSLVLLQHRVTELIYFTDEQPAVGDTRSQTCGRTDRQTARLCLHCCGVEKRHRRAQLRIILIFLF
jgi:hypothetical protein